MKIANLLLYSQRIERSIKTFLKKGRQSSISNCSYLFWNKKSLELSIIKSYCRTAVNRRVLTNNPGSRIVATFQVLSFVLRELATSLIGSSLRNASLFIIKQLYLTSTTIPKYAVKFKLGNYYERSKKAVLQTAVALIALNFKNKENWWQIKQQMIQLE